MRAGFFLFLLALDVVSKIAAIAFIPSMSPANTVYPFGGIGVFSGPVTFSLNYVINTGAVWGLFAGHSGLLFILRTAIILGLLFYLARERTSLSKFSLGLVVTGAVGNVIDYCLYGHVIDFLHFTFWGYSFPIFNVADMCITIGVLSLLLFSRQRAQVL